LINDLNSNVTRFLVDNETVEFEKYVENNCSLRNPELQLNFRRKTIVIPQAAHQALGMIFDVGILRFTTSFCHYSRSPST
jgi:hypothetical protein